MLQATSIDQENSGVRIRLMPSARSASTVVAMETDAATRATTTRPKATIQRSVPSASVPPGPPSMA